MKLQQRTNREVRDLFIVLMISIAFALFSITTQLINKVYDFFKVYTSLRIAEFFIYFAFLYLAGLLWISYRRWTVTERRRRELEEIISSISPDVLLVVDQDRTVTVCNDSIKRLFGYEPDEIINRKVETLRLERKSETGKAIEILQGGHFEIGLATGQKKNGDFIHLEVITGTLSNRGGTVLLLRDITMRKKAEEALRQSEQRFVQLIESLPVAVLMIDARGKPCYENKISKQLLNRAMTQTNQDIGIENLTQFYRAYVSESDEVYPAHRFPLIRALSGERATIDDVEIRYDDKTIPLEISATPIFDEQGAVTHAIATFTDITDRKLMEEGIIRARNFYLSILDEFVSPIWRSGTDAKYNYVNSAWLNFTGRAIEQERGDGWTQGIHADDMQRTFETYIVSFRTRKPFEMTYRMRRYDGVYRLVIHSGKPFNDAQGTFAGYIGSLCDITACVT
ncbi:MAG: PAS domain S-box protein [Dissulfurispiraceae bacterium]